MRKLIIVISGILIAVIWLKAENPNNEGLRSITPTPIANGESIKIVKAGENEYAYWIYRIKETENLGLIENYGAKKNTKTIIEENSCKAGINGGFYNEDDKPLGLVVINKKIINNKISSSLFNGYITIDNQRKTMIADKYTDSTIIFGLQTGPILKKDGMIRELSMAQDKAARRMVMATDNNKTYIMAITGKDGRLEGPSLTELPSVIQTISKQENLNFESAINLDGGSASAFYTPDIKIEEWQPVGSWWCVK